MPAKKRSSEKEKLYTWTKVYLVGLILFFVPDFIPSLYRHSPRQQFYFMSWATLSTEPL